MELQAQYDLAKSKELDVDFNRGSYRKALVVGMDEDYIALSTHLDPRGTPVSYSVHDRRDIEELGNAHYQKWLSDAGYDVSVPFNLQEGMKLNVSYKDGQMQSAGLPLTECEKYLATALDDGTITNSYDHEPPHPDVINNIRKHLLSDGASLHVGGFSFSHGRD